MPTNLNTSTTKDPCLSVLARLPGLAETDSLDFALLRRHSSGSAASTARSGTARRPGAEAGRSQARPSARKP